MRAGAFLGYPRINPNPSLAGPWTHSLVLSGIHWYLGSKTPFWRMRLINCAVLVSGEDI